MVIFLSYILVQLYKVFRRIFKKRIDGLLFIQAMIQNIIKRATPPPVKHISIKITQVMGSPTIIVERSTNCLDIHITLVYGFHIVYRVPQNFSSQLRGDPMMHI